MSYPQVVNEVASAINAVIHVIVVSVAKVLPVLAVMIIGLAAIDVFVGDVSEVTAFKGEAFKGDAQPEPFLSDAHQAEIQLSSNTSVDTAAVNQE